MKKFLLSCFILTLPSYLFAQVVVGDSTVEDAETKAELENTAPINGEVKMESPAFFKIGGALRFNYQYRDWDDSHKRQGGAFTFDTWRINVDGQSKGVLISLEYRFYSGYHMFHHGWFGYNISDQTQIQLGINQVPFGILPYASHSWFFQTAYYAGFEDDYDMGLKLQHRGANWDLDFAFYKGAEPTLSGSSLASARFSYDVVPTSDDNKPEYITPGTPGVGEDSVINSSGVYGKNEEINQFNLSAAYNFTPNFQLGASLQGSGIYNQEASDFNVDDMGTHFAGALHVNADVDDFNFIGEYIYYKYNLPDIPGQSEERVVMGAYDFPYYVAAKAQMFMAGISYTVDTDWGPISSLTFYDNYTYMDKLNSDFVDTQQHVIGCLVSAGNLYTYMDIASGQNHPWLGPFSQNWNQGLSAGSEENARLLEEPEWHTRVNINFGYYF